MNNKYTEKEKKQILEDLKELGQESEWYHKIDLGDGIVTPGRDYDNIWNPIKNTMDNINYKDKDVLDLASWDGMWAFEAEKRGAKLVVSTDTRLKGYKNLLYVRNLLKSNIIPMCNVPVQDLVDRLRTVGLTKKYDIVHHLGLFYHLRDPLLSLAQVRKVISDDGTLVLETAFIDNNEESYMLFSGLPGNHHFYGISDTWAPTLLAIKEILIRSDFTPYKEDEWIKVLPSKMQQTKYKHSVGRITILAKPTPVNDLHPIDNEKIYGDQ